MYSDSLSDLEKESFDGIINLLDEMTDEMYFKNQKTKTN